MKKLLITFVAVFGLLGSLSAFAAVELKPGDYKRIEKEVISQSKFANLNEKETQALRDMKVELNIKNREAAAEFGRGSAEFKKARKKIMKAYQAKLYKIVTKEEVQKWRKAQRG